MGRFSDNGLKKTSPKVSEDALAAEDQKTNKPIVEKHDQKTAEDIYTAEQLKPVNVGGFRVPLAVRAHWQSSAKLNGDKVATLLRDYLKDRYGLPDGISEEDLFC
ncbi:MAG: hypothetical protein DCF25_02315 [Leptolyngbya foveolarum]|uniref:Uncharacterized protein n=1 Tax=Leptolyngbya foveolarum TaxID=47253 RepID=A0A2W4UTR1_9CYAN|nr:MAG: hypothetical protein DCF25_02315 [Leptolyngbya foveolarum]